MISKNTILYIYSILCTTFCFSQNKFEREYRIDEQKVPELAISFIDSSLSQKNIKWYAEESQDGKTIEAKTKHNGNRYSIEFDVKGNILDIEKTIPFKSLPTNTQKVIKTTLDSIFTKHIILKIQTQWLANRNTLLELVKHQSSKNNYQTNYEIIVKGKKESVYLVYEALLDQKGKVIKLLEVIQRSSDNIQF